MSKKICVFFLLTILISGCSTLKTINDITDIAGKDNLAEDLIIGQFVKDFRKDRPISTSINDAYPVVANIKDYSPRPITRKMMQELKDNGKILLKQGVYDFYLRSFCLNAGRYAPTKGSGYLIAPLKGERAQIVQNILKNYPKQNNISQSQAQSLIWAIEVGSTYSELSTGLKLIAEKLLSEEDKKALGKSFWSILPKSVQDKLFRELKSKLPDDVRDMLEVYYNVKNKINSADATYEDIENIAMRFGEPPIPKDMKEVEMGSWSNVEGNYYMRVFPNGYTRTRVQVYVANDKAGGIEFSPLDNVGTPANTSCQRLGFGNEWSKESDYGEESDKEPEDEKDEVEIEYKEGEHLSNPEVIDALKDLAEQLGADKILVTDGNRSRAEHEAFYDKLPLDERVSYENTQHGTYQGYKAADVKFYKDGKQINPFIVAETAILTGKFGGIGLYKNFNHLDLRPLKPGENIHLWKTGY